MAFQSIEILWYLLIPVLCIPLFIFRKWIKSVGYAECLLPASMLCIQMIGQLVVPYSVWPYILFIYTWLGIIQLIVNYRSDYYFTFGEFFRKWFTLICVSNLIIWFILVVYRLITLFL